LRALQDAAAAKTRGEQARARLADEGEVARAARRLPEAEAELQKATEAVTAAEEALDRLQGQHIAGADERLRATRGALEAVAGIVGLDHSDQGSALSEISNTVDLALDADDAELAKAAKLPTENAIAKATLNEARAQRLAADEQAQQLRRLAARAQEMAAAHVELDAAIANYKDAKARSEQAIARRDEARRVRAELIAQFTELDIKDEALETTRGTLADQAVLVPHLNTAEARLAELEPQLEAAKAELTRLEAELSATPVPELPSPVPDVATYKRLVEDRESDLRSAAAAVAVAEQRHADELASLARLAELEAQRAGLDDELADWNRLAADLGRDGLQAQLIDAAIPELNHVTNELLHEAFGPRFTVDVRTQALDAKGKRTLETLDVVVIDTVNGREALAETYSGGERVILQEALSLALTVLACRQSGVERPTLVRDESGAALSEGKAPQWVAMLRRAVTLIGAEHCLFVSHTPATWELADARIHLGGTT
jgi:exonuclease SbcC